MDNNDYLAHYGVKGMKWGVRRFKNRGVTGTIRDIQRHNAQKTINKSQTKQKQVSKELKELKGYSKNPSNLGKSKVSTAIRNRQIKSLNKTNSKLKSNIKDNKQVLKELDSIEKYKANKKTKVSPDKMERKSRKQDMKNRRTLSDADIKKKIERMKLEQELSRLTKSDISPGRKFIEDVISASGKKVLSTAIAGSMAYAVKVAMTNEFNPKEAAAYIASNPNKKK